MFGDKEIVLKELLLGGLYGNEAKSHLLNGTRWEMRSPTYTNLLNFHLCKVSKINNKHISFIQQEICMYFYDISTCLLLDSYHILSFLI